jgi:hypothetical protein
MSNTMENTSTIERIPETDEEYLNSDIVKLEQYKAEFTTFETDVKKNAIVFAKNKDITVINDIIKSLHNTIEFNQSDNQALRIGGKEVETKIKLMIDQVTLPQYYSKNKDVIDEKMKKINENFKYIENASISQSRNIKSRFGRNTITNEQLSKSKQSLEKFKSDIKNFTDLLDFSPTEQDGEKEIFFKNLLYRIYRICAVYNKVTFTNEAGQQQIYTDFVRLYELVIKIIQENYKIEILNETLSIDNKEIKFYDNIKEMIQENEDKKGGKPRTKRSRKNKKSKNTRRKSIRRRRR